MPVPHPQKLNTTTTRELPSLHSCSLVLIAQELCVSCSHMQISIHTCRLTACPGPNYDRTSLSTTHNQIQDAPSVSKCWRHPYTRQYLYLYTDYILPHTNAKILCAHCPIECLEITQKSQKIAISSVSAHVIYNAFAIKKTIEKITYFLVTQKYFDKQVPIPN